LGFERIKCLVECVSLEQLEIVGVEVRKKILEAISAENDPKCKSMIEWSGREARCKKSKNRVYESKRTTAAAEGCFSPTTLSYLSV